MTPALPTPVDVGAMLDRGRWTPYQKALTLLAATAVMFDGFDLQILGFAIPSIMREWHVARAAFAPVAAIGLAGMALGSPLAGYLGDRIGRRLALILCVTVFGAATVATAFAPDLTWLAILRFLTGMGVGGALPNAAAFTAEFAPARRRPLAVTFTLICVPLGGMVGGAAATHILPAFGWHVMYLAGGIAPLLLATVLLAALPESPRFLARHPHRWSELSRLLTRLGHPAPPGSQFEDRAERAAEGRAAWRSLLGDGYLRDTLGLWITYFASLNGIYLVFGWLPAMLTARGLSLAAASSGLTAYNAGGVLGAVIGAALLTVWGSRKPMIAGAIAGAASGVALIFIGIQAGGSHALLIAGIGLNGLFANGVQTTLFALAAHVYPTKVRASGVAAAAAVGRVGGLLSSLTGAAIIQAGIATFWSVLSVSMFCAAIGLMVVRRHFHGR